MIASLFLVNKMSLGYGVSVVIDNVANRLINEGHKCAVACLYSDQTFHRYPIYIVKPVLSEIEHLASLLHKPTIVAHTSPFFELLPLLINKYRCFAWEHGDPTPDLFTHDRDSRIKIIKNKRQNVYGKMDAVIAISNFVKHDTGWKQSRVLYNGCNHAPDMGTKDFGFFCLVQGQPLRLGTLMRFGKGEAMYKGNSIFLKIVSMLRSRGNIAVKPAIMGAGETSEASIFEKQGFEIHLNATEDEKWKFLRGLDIFVSPSLWEGFNLPLVEAQALGTASIAFDVGVHPEVTPYVCSCIRELCLLVEHFSRNKKLLFDASRASYYFVRNKFLWENTCAGYVKMLHNLQGVSDDIRAVKKQNRIRKTWKNSLSTAFFLATLHFRKGKILLKKILKMHYR